MFRISGLCPNIRVLFKNHYKLNEDLQEMSELNQRYEHSFYPLLFQIQEMALQLDEVQAAAAVQQIDLDNSALKAAAAVENKTCVASFLTTIEKSLCQLWEQQPLIESVNKFTRRIHGLNIKSQDDSDDTTSSSIEPNYKPNFKQVFYNKTSTIAVFLVIYETTMIHANYELKRGHILTCLHPICQEVVIPELANITFWAQMKKMLIDKVGGDLTLEGQQLITSQQLSIKEAYTACANSLKVNQLLFLHFKAHKPMLTSMKGIKTLLQDMHLIHTNLLVREN
ncbi:hypothetical protein DSO57_1025959 [Entomophthora muscae]|uniref:Uncharacterized protein n=1 Tax=Entomophthora muscae TaxID=34485 RepID=A0ACC2SR50_9FUNG|nr:hypothetical protein DSO57_1025959 [Entomophthora muscae]